MPGAQPTKPFADSTVSEWDFEQLPPTLRRKFFSSLERLRLAEDGIVRPSFGHHRMRKHRAVGAFQTTSSHTLRRKFNRLDDRLPHQLSWLRKQVKLACKPQPTVDSVTREDIAHFAALPSALRRKLYTVEEQILLSSKTHSSILDAADETIYRKYGFVDSDSDTSLLDTADAAHDPSNLNFGSLPDDMDFTVSELESFRWLDEPKDLDLSLHDYHTALAETAIKHDEPQTATSHRRSRSLSGFTFPRRDSSLRSGVGSRAVSPTTISSQSKTLASLPVGRHYKRQDSTSSLDPAARHYQDPTARMKLRVYLASPQKFDEAVEFGFPSLRTLTPTPPVRPGSGRPAAAAAPARTFLIDVDDDTPSLSDGEDREMEEIDSPKTPSMPAFARGLSHDTHLNPANFRPRITRDSIDTYVPVPSSEREMTLRMTLTRPDLRSPDAEKPKHVNSRPLELPPLIESPASAAFWDSLPDEEPALKRFFKRLRLR